MRRRITELQLGNALGRLPLTVPFSSRRGGMEESVTTNGDQASVGIRGPSCVSQLTKRIGGFRLWALALLCVTILTLISSPVGSSRNLATTCVGDNQKLSVARGTTLSTYGIKADLEYQTTMTLCTGQANETSSTAWVMIAGGQPATDGWAQIGYGNFRYYTPDYVLGYHIFCQWTPHSNPVTLTTKYYPPNPTTTNFRVFFNSYHNFLAMQVNGSPTYTNSECHTDFDPFSLWTTPFWNQAGGEAAEPATDMVGRVSDAEQFANVQMLNAPYPNGTWGSISDLTLLCSSSLKFNNKWGQRPTLFYVWTGDGVTQTCG